MVPISDDYLLQKYTIVLELTKSEIQYQTDLV